jgi:transaldolase
MTSAVARLAEHGQSPWYDNLNRDFIVGGGLARMIHEHGVAGATSNPTIFEKAVSGSDAYDEQLARLAGNGLAPTDIYWELMLADIERASEVFRPVHDERDGRDGFVSVEVDPGLAHDTDGTIEQARLLHQRLGQPTVMVKIPGTSEGIPAVEAMIAEGRNVNVTLIFGLERYAEVIEAYVRGLERFADAGGDPATVASVASFFVSRVDTEVDRRLPDDHPLRGRAAVANAKLAYRIFRERFGAERWQELAHRGGRVQRPLWASTSTKNPAYPDTLYVDELVGRDTVNTLADESVEALLDHGDPRADTVEERVEEAEAVLAGLVEAGVDVDDVTATLEREGVDKFAESFRTCLATIEKRAADIGP